MRSRAREVAAAREGTLRLVNPDFTSLALIDLLGAAGFDGIFIDCEHRFANVEQVQDMVRAAHHAGMIAMVRPELTLPSILARYLDTGADGLVIPHIETAADARAAVAAVREARWNDHETKLLFVIIESVVALANVDAIVATAGLAGVMIGPNDLAQSMGLAGQPAHADVRAAFDLVVPKAHAAGLLAGAPPGYGGLSTPGQSGGYVTYVHADRLLANACADYLAAVG